MTGLWRDMASGAGRELVDIVQALCALLAILMVVHPTGAAGREIHEALMQTVGFAALPAAAAWAYLALRSLFQRPPLAGSRRLALLMGLCWAACALSVMSPPLGGSAGAWAAAWLRHAVGMAGAVLVLFAWLLACGVLGLERGVLGALFGAGADVALAGGRMAGRGVVAAGRTLIDFVAPPEGARQPAAAGTGRASRRRPPLTVPDLLAEAAAPSDPTAEGATAPAAIGGAEPSLADAAPKPLDRPAGPLVQALLPGDYRPPPLSLLERGTSRAAGAGEATGRRRLLEETLTSFGVTAHVVDAVQGPAVTRFEIQPAPGIKVARILSLQDDIALALAAPRVRIEAPIPGRNVVGIEVPNLEVAQVRLREILESAAFQREASPLAVALGKDVAGAPVVAALDRMPHLLIAGATGSGKSVCVNVIIASLLFRTSPRRVRLILIDPKVVELGQYDGVPHLMLPVVTDPREALGALLWAVKEMERRYRQFAERGARDIARYNALLGPGEAPLPHIVVVVDELADLMMVASNKVEDAIARLAQMARAAGIHMVVATQRPSVDVITGLIKANIPSRLAFAVSSQVDSRTILDTGGAEKLLGRGDMLFSPMGAPKPIRAQGALITEGELEALLAFVKAQGAPAYEDDLIRSAKAAAVEEEPEAEEDALFADALRVVIDAKGASASLLQRRLRIGYSRAARLVDAMADRGYVGPPDGARPRQVHLTMAEYGRLFAERQLGAAPPPDAPDGDGSAP